MPPADPPVSVLFMTCNALLLTPALTAKGVVTVISESALFTVMGSVTAAVFVSASVARSPRFSAYI